MSDRSELIFKLQRDVKFRAAYIRSKLNLLIPSQLRGLRLKGKTTQKQLADEAEMKQPRISAMERPGEIKFSLETLIRMAAVHKVGLPVRFVPFSEMLHWENDYSQDTFVVTRLDEDTQFIDPVLAINAPLEMGAPTSNELAVDQRKEPQSAEGATKNRSRAAAAGGMHVQYGSLGGI